jgi:hypothetical protein
MPDLLDSIQRQLRERLDELRPLVVEYQRLAAAEQALDEGHGHPGSSTSRPARRRSPRRRQSTARRAATGASRTANRDKLLAVVGERPGVTKAELKDATGLSSAGVAQNLRRLVARGQIREEPLPGEQVGYRVGEPDGDRSSPKKSASPDTTASG